MATPGSTDPPKVYPNPYAYQDDPYSDFWAFEWGYNHRAYTKGVNPYAAPGGAYTPPATTAPVAQPPTPGSHPPGWVDPAEAKQAAAKQAALESWYLGGPAGGNWETDPSLIYGRTNTQGYAHQPNARRYFSGVDQNTETFYQTNPDQAFSAAIGQEAAPDSYYARWLKAQWDDVNRGLVQANTTNPDLLTTDYLERAIPGLASRYLALPGWQQGKGDIPWFAGRRS